MAAPAAPRPSPSLFWRVALGVVLAFCCFWVVGPVVLLVASLVGVVALFAGANALNHVGGYDPGVYAVGLRLALFVLLPGLLAGAHRATRGITERGLWRWIPRTLDLPSLFFATVGLSVVTCSAASAEWNGNPWLPDELATTTVLASLLVFGACAPLVLLVLVLVVHWKVYGWAAASATRLRLLTVMLGAGVVAWNVMAFGAVPGVRESATALAPPALPPAMRADVQRAHAADSATEWSRLMLHAVVAPSMAAVSQAASPPPPMPSASGSAGVISAEAEDARLNDCFRQLYAQADREVATMLARRFRIDPADAHDLAREALIHVCLAHAKKPYPNLAAALTRAAERRAIDNYRKIRRRECALPEEEIACRWTTDQDDVRLDGERRALRRALCELPPKGRVAVELWSLGMSGAEIAAELRVSETEAHNLTQNGIKKLRRDLEHACSPP